MKLRDVPIAGGAAAAAVGAALALTSSAALGRPSGIPLGVAAAVLAGGIGGHLGSRALGRRMAARLSMLNPTGGPAPARPATPPPTGWPHLDTATTNLGQALARLDRDRVELEEFQRLTRALVISAREGSAEESEALDARQCLQDMLDEFGQAATLVIQAAETLNEATERMAAGAAEQAGAVARTATTVEALSDDIDLISRNAEAACEASEHARDEARRGLEQVHEAIEGMDRLLAHVEANGRKVRRLGDRSVEIGTITDMIKGISQRTDMLALNATIESVRAGEHGRGFAVVAEEIRKLAERAAIATREIGTLVEAIQGDTQDSIRALGEEQAEVEAEAERVREAGAALERISEFAELSARLVERISHSTGAQVRATQDLVGDAQQISEVAQQTLDGAARARDYVRKLSQRCGRLQRLASPDAIATGLVPADGIVIVKPVVSRPRLAAIGRTS